METIHNILVVDDDEVSREMLMEALRRSGYQVHGAESAEEALRLVEKTMFDLVLTDVRMEGISGIELVERIKKKSPDVPVVVMTAFGNSDITIEAIRAGAFDFVSKPFQLEKMRRIIANALEKRILVQERKSVETVESANQNVKRIIGQSEKMIDVFKLIGRVANTESTVLIMGESGTGKELAARAIHEYSYRRDKPFIAINCGAIPEALLESELFGYEKGAFTGAEKTHLGIFEAVHGGTCLLDEIGEMPITMQSKILRTLQDGEIRRVGSNREIRVDVRLIAATNRNLEEMVKEMKFREDLYYRLNVVRINLPPLRERKEDIPVLAEYFLHAYQNRNRRNELWIDKETMRLLTNYSWPGNVRELENVVESAATLSPSAIITKELLPNKIKNSGIQEIIMDKVIPEDRRDEIIPLAEIEKLYILRVLKMLDDNKSMAARMLGLDRKTLRMKLKQYGYETQPDETE